MANDLDDLTNARKVLTEVRLNWAKALAAGYKRGETEIALKSLIEIQQAIEVIDIAMNELEEAELEEEADDEWKARRGRRALGLQVRRDQRSAAGFAIFLVAPERPVGQPHQELKIVADHRFRHPNRQDHMIFLIVPEWRNPSVTPPQATGEAHTEARPECPARL
jgi:hypothetical protein